MGREIKINNYKNVSKWKEAWQTKKNNGRNQQKKRKYEARYKKRVVSNPKKKR